jgi:hypothetical protein
VRIGRERDAGERRAWKIELIEKSNPTWRDLFGAVVGDDGFEW